MFDTLNFTKIFILVNGHTSSGGWFRGGSIVYNSVTPAPCDCATELLKSCYLAYIPIVGCVVSVMNLAESSVFTYFHWLRFIV